MRKPPRTHAELRIPDGADAVVRANRGLIGAALKLYFPWLTNQFAQLREDCEAVALFSLAKAARDHDPAKGKYSTVAMTYIRNDVTNELTRQKRARRLRPVESLVASDTSLSPDMEAVMAEVMSRACRSRGLSLASLTETPCLFEEPLA